ncbi:MAG: glycerophosphodiester phosphodiesterase family protein [Planctomycetota bacterium]
MTVLDRFRWAGTHLRAALRPAVTFEFGSTLLFVVCFLPAFGWILNFLVARSGQFAVSDNDLFGFFFSIPGAAFALLGLGFVLAYWFAEQSAVLIITQRAGAGRIAWDNKDLPALAMLGVRQAAITLAAALPFLAGIGATFWLLLREWDFYFYLNVRPPEFWVAATLIGLQLAAYLVLAAWLHIRWMLAIPILLFEKLPAREALRASWSRSRGRFRTFGWPLIVNGGAAILGGAITTAAIGFAASWFLRESESLAVLLPGVVVTLLLVAATDIAWFILGKLMHVMLLARAYIDTAPTQEIPTENGAEVKRPLPPIVIRTACGIAALLLIASSVTALGAYFHRYDADRAIFTTGHRGSKRRAPENTLAALRQAISEGADYAEIDVQTTKDGVVVLLHDADLMRVAHVRRRLNAMNHAELADIDVGSWFDPQFASERVPTLQDAIDVCRGKIRLNIELKYTWEDPTLARSVCALVHENGFKDESVLSSLNFRALEEVRRIDPEMKIGFIVFQAVGRLTRMDADFLSLSAGQVSADLVRTAQRRGREVHVWTVNDLPNTLAMIEMGVDNLITDEPAQLRAWLDEWNALSDTEKVVLMLRNLVFGLEPPEADDL